MPNRQVIDVQDGTTENGSELAEEEDFYFGSGRVRSGQDIVDEEVAIQLQFDEYEADPKPSKTVPSETPEATTVFESLERIRKEVVLKLQEMEETRKVDKEEQARWNGRIATNQSSIDKLTSHIKDTKTLLESLVEKKICIFCGEDHLIAVCPLAGEFVSKAKNPFHCLYCGKGGHIMADCVHASDFILKISKVSYPDDTSTPPEDDIDVDSDTSKDLYECLTDGQIETLITNPNIWQPGQTALFCHDSNIYLKARIVEKLPFNPMSKVPPAYRVYFKAGDVQTTVGHRQLLKLKDTTLEIPTKSPKPIKMTQQYIKIGQVCKRAQDVVLIT
jgi:hypothetical protein